MSSVLIDDGAVPSSISIDDALLFKLFDDVGGKVGVPISGLMKPFIVTEMSFWSAALYLLNESETLQNKLGGLTFANARKLSESIRKRYYELEMQRRVRPGVRMAQGIIKGGKISASDVGKTPLGWVRDSQTKASVKKWIEAAKTDDDKASGWGGLLSE